VSGPSLTVRQRELGKRLRDLRYQHADVSIEPYIGLEAEATAITCYSMSHVPGLLQTEEYARALIKALAPKMALNPRDSIRRLHELRKLFSDE
jgi:Domain of unknown function (DUF5753)